MSAIWLAVVGLGLATIAIKALGPVLLGGRALPRPLVVAVPYLAPALLAALIVTQTMTAGQQLVLDARAAGLAVALVAVVLRAPLLVVVGSAAGATALVRLLL